MQPVPHLIRRALLLLVVAAAPAAFADTDPCKAAAELEAAKKVAADADAALKAQPGPATKPAGEPAAADEALKKAEAAVAVEEAASKLAEAARTAAQQAWAAYQTANGLGGLADAAAVTAAATGVRGKRDQAVAALAGVDRKARADIVVIRASDMRPLEARIRGRMGQGPDTVEAQLDDPASGCSDAGVVQANATLQAARDALATLGRKEQKGLETAEDINAAGARAKAVADGEKAVAAAVAACKTAARADLSKWLVKKLEADTLEAKLFPDEATRALVADLPNLNARLTALESAATVVAAADKAKKAATDAKAKVAEKQLAATQARALQKAHSEWAPRAKLVEAKTTADADVAAKETAITTAAAATATAVKAAVAAGNAALARIQGAVKADLAKITADLAKDARTQATTDKAGFVKQAADLKASAGKITAEQIASIRQAWATKKKEIVSGAHAKERTQHSARRKQAAGELATEIAKLAPYLCFDEVKKVEEAMNLVRTEWDNSGLELVVPPGMELDLGDLDLPEAAPQRISVNATFVETIVNGEAAKTMTETLAVTFDLTSGAITGTFSGSGSGEIDSGCNSRLRYTYGHSGAVSGSVTPGGGPFTLPISPHGSTSATFVKKGDCEFRPEETGPWSGKGTITGTLTKEGAVTLTSRWQVKDIVASGRWSGAGAVSP